MRAICEKLEARQLMTVSTAVAGVPASLVDADGTAVTFTLKGNGVATIEQDSPETPMRISLSGTDAKTDLLAVASGGDGAFVLGGLSADSAIDQVALPAAQLVWADVSLPKVKQLSLGSVAGSMFVSNSLGKVTVGGSFAQSRVESPEIVDLKIAGDLTDSWLGLYPMTDDQPQGLDKLTVAGTMTNSTVDALTDIGKVTTAAMLDSFVVAGVRYSETTNTPVLPAERSEGKDFDFTGYYKISSVIVTGKGEQDVSFDDSVVAAYKLGTVSLNEVSGDTVGDPFGVSGYRVKQINRKFEGAYAKKNKQARPDVDFVARQIFEPLVFTYTPSGGGSYASAASYSAATAVSGYLSGSVVRLAGNSGIIDPLPSYPKTLNVKVASVTNSNATGIYLVTDGSYEVRDASDATLFSTADLPTAIEQLIGVEGKQIKELPGSTLLTTSIGPRVQLTNIGKTYKIEVGTPVYETVVEWTSPPLSVAAGLSPTGTSGSSQSMPAPGTPGTRTRHVLTNPESVAERTIPSATGIKSFLATESGQPVRTFSSLLMLQSDPLTIGKRIDAGKTDNVSVLPGFSIIAGDISSASFAQLLLDGEQLAGGSRRAPVRMKLSDGKLIVYGVRFGGTAVFSQAGQTVLDANGDLLDLPTAAGVKAEITATGVSVQSYGF